MYQVGDLFDNSNDVTATTLEIAHSVAIQISAQSDEVAVGVWEIDADGDAELVAIVHQGEVYTR